MKSDTGVIKKKEREHLPAIVNGRLVRVSPSQVDTYKVCPRKWAYGKVFNAEKVEAPYDPTKGKDFGGICHAEIEGYLLTGVDGRGFLPRMGDSLLQPYASHFPFSGGTGQVEAALASPTLETPGGVIWVGYIDFFLPHAVPRSVVIDHKFKGDIKKSGKTEEELKTDVQAVVYGWWTVEHEEIDSMEFRHHNHQTKADKPRVEPVGVVLERAHLEQEFDKLCALVDGPMQFYASAKRPEDVPTGERDPKDCCWAFGGCEYAHICPAATPAVRKKKLAQLEAQTVAKQKKEGSYVTQAMKAEEGKWYVVNGQVAKKFGKAGPKIKFELPDGTMLETGLLEDVVESTVIPESTVLLDKVPESAPPGRLFVNVTPPLPIGQRITNEHATIPPAPDMSPHVNEYPPGPTPASTLPPIESPTAPPPQEPRKRGRPVKNKVVEPQTHPALSPSEPHQLLETVVAEKLSTPVEKPVEKATHEQVIQEIQKTATVMHELKSEVIKAGANAPLVRIYIEQPVSGEVEKKSLMPYVEEIRAKLEEKYKIADARLVPDKSDLAYGRWKAIIQLMAKDNPPPPGAYEAFRGDFACEILQGLRELPQVMMAGYILK